MNDQDKPQEWTEVRITAICDKFPTFWQTALVNEINAALAAEREKWIKLCDKTSDNATKAEQQLTSQREKLDHEIMCHAACGVIAMSNTRESLAKNRVMKPEYLSASVQDCIRMAEREIELQQQLAEERENLATVRELRELDQKQLVSEREKRKLWESRYYETNEALEKTQEELATQPQLTLLIEFVE